MLTLNHEITDNLDMRFTVDLSSQDDIDCLSAYLNGSYPDERFIADYFSGTKYDLVSPESVGALTTAPIFGIVELGDNGDIDHIESLYWYPDYAIRFALDVLLERGSVIFTRVELTD